MSEQPGNEQRVIAGRYRLLAPLGEGGMGVVWRARDDVLGREVAVKEVRAPSGLGATDGERLYARLEREAWAAARISHRNVITVYDVATEEGRPWIVMELVRGLSLSDVLDGEGPLSPQHAARIGTEVLAALRAAHEAGVLHRDVKPGNVLIANDGRVVLTDFGIAMVEGSSALTMTGELIGSPEFLAPERAMGRTPGPESDLWSLGVLLYAAVEGNSPFRQNTPLSTLRAVVDEELPRPVRAGALAPVIEGLLRKDPAERMSAGEAERLLRIVGGGGTPRTGAVPVASGLYSPAVTGSTPVAGSSPYGGHTPLPTPQPLPSATTSTTTRDRPRRGAVVLAAGVVALLLAVGGITWALVNANADSTDDPGTASGGASSGATGGDDGGSNGSGSGGGGDSDSDSGGKNGGGTDGADTSTGTTGGDTDDNGGNGGGDTGGNGGTGANGGGNGGGNGGTTAPPHQSVRVTVTTVTGSYSGTCPPPEGQAPSFTATFTVGRVPAEVGYRWVTGSGESSDSGWKTLSFGAGEEKSKQVNHTELTYKEGETHHDEISVEVKSPVRATSNSVSFSVTCEQETPTGGASYTAGSPAAAQIRQRR
ncbi:serine/threonine protein kinase [Streptomyces sp. ISL-96]|uniref:serine/threonine-protein kinase n=1 Tax=Streptomyces sp. ISL-96 TaxID=2819191 RepID=UPI001BE86074|nr:serine/threonine-protein kinase [Streptomyces sp. ISL-96]MBT2490320.1 serine/threonine protein kinase [Streptomyces sp. ISL-96]